MAPQHPLTTAPGLTGWNTENLTMNGQFRHAFGWTNAQPEARRTFGHYNRAWPSRNAGRIIGWPEAFNADQFDSCRWLAREALDQLDRDFWSDPMTATADHTADTHDILTAILAEIRTFWQTHWTPPPRVAFECYGQPAAGTTTQTSLHVGKDGLTRPPESYPPSYFPEWLDLRFFRFDWID